MRIRLGREEIVEAIRDYVREEVVQHRIEVGEVILSEGSRTAEIELDTTAFEAARQIDIVETKVDEE